MIFTDFSIKNRTTIIFIIALIITGGIYAFKHLGKLEDPEFTIKTALIVTPYPGASPHEVEQQVTRIVEEAVQSTDEVEHIRSVSRAGVSMVYVDLNEYNYTDVIQQLWDMLRRKVRECQFKLPPGAGPSLVYDNYSDVYGIFLALTGDGYTYAELKNYADYFQRELTMVKDVERISLFGARTELINIEISMAKCATMGITPRRLIELLGRQNEIVNAGTFEFGEHRIRIAASGVLDELQDITNLVIQQTDNEQVLLKDLCRITREYIEPPEPMMRYNGKQAIGISISTSSGANVVTMGDAVQTRLDQLLEGVPVGIDIGGIYYQSKFVKSAINQFMINLAESVLIVIGVLLFAMGWRSGIIIAGNLVLSIMATLVVMLIWGIDLQRVSLGALILVMGMIVDNSIVVADSTLVNLQKGKNRKEAILDSARNTAWPLLGATVIACLAFLPIYMAPTNAGEFCASLFQVVTIALLISWLLAMSQTPVFCHYFMKVKNKKKQSDPHSGPMYRLYRRILGRTLRYRMLTLLTMAGLLVLGILGFKNIPKIFFADSDKAQFFIDYRRPEGTQIQVVSKDIKKVEKALQSFSEVKNVTACIGQSPPRFATSFTPEPRNACFGQLIVNVDDYRNIDNLIEQLGVWFEEQLPEGDAHMWKYISGPKADYRVEARFTGPDPKVLRGLSEEAKAIMRSNPLAKNVCDDWRERVMVVNSVYAQQKGRQAGVERVHLANSLMSLTDGLPVGYFRESNDLIPIKVLYNAPVFNDIEAIPVWGSSPASVPLGQIVKTNEITWEDPVLYRYDRQRVIRAQCDPIQGVTANKLLSQLRPEIETIDIPEGYNLEWEGEYELSVKGNQGVQQFLPLALLCMVLILVVLFNTIRHPLIIILTIPLSMIGITAGLLLFRQPFGFVAMLGAYSLIGMLIKNAVVLIDQINVEISEGKKPLQAVEDSCVSRMRPVMMASVTTIFGMIPLLTDAMFISMAVTIMFGLAFATVLTLIFIPVLYTIFFKIKTSA